MTTEWLTVQEIAEQWQVHPETVRRAVKRKHLPAFVYGSNLRIRAKDWQDFVARHTTGTPARSA